VYLSSRAPAVIVAAASRPSVLASVLARGPEAAMPPLPVAGGSGAAALGEVA